MHHTYMSISYACMYIVHILYILWTFVYPSSTTWHPAVPRLTMGRSSQRLRPLLSTCQRFVRCGVAVACSPEMLPASPKASDVCNYFQSNFGQKKISSLPGLSRCSRGPIWCHQVAAEAYVQCDFARHRKAVLWHALAWTGMVKTEDLVNGRGYPLVN